MKLIRRSPSYFGRRLLGRRHLGQSDRRRHPGVQALDALASARESARARRTCCRVRCRSPWPSAPTTSTDFAIELGLAQRCSPRSSSPYTQYPYLAQDVEAARQIDDAEHLDELGAARPRCAPPLASPRPSGSSATRTASAAKNAALRNTAPRFWGRRSDPAPRPAGGPPGGRARARRTVARLGEDANALVLVVVGQPGARRNSGQATNSGSTPARLADVIELLVVLGLAAEDEPPHVLGPLQEYRPDRMLAVDQLHRLTIDPPRGPRAPALTPPRSGTRHPLRRARTDPRACRPRLLA